MLAPIAWRTPPKHYGPWESIASLLTEGAYRARVVHARAVARFGADRMVEDYLRTYEALLMSASTSPSGA